jgi:hypothetical protein
MPQSPHVLIASPSVPVALWLRTCGGAGRWYDEVDDPACGGVATFKHCRHPRDSFAAMQAGQAQIDAVLFSPDLFPELFPWLDRASKVALRGVSRAMCSQVDASIEVVASPSEGFSAAHLTDALVRWPAVRDLTLLLNVGGGADLAALATTSLTRLTSLTMRQTVGHTAHHGHDAAAHALFAWHDGRAWHDRMGRIAWR